MARLVPGAIPTNGSRGRADWRPRRVRGYVARDRTLRRHEQGATTSNDPAAPRRISGGVLTGVAYLRPQPEYPPMARAAGINGAVVVEVIVDDLGMVMCARAVSGHPLLRDAATMAARHWIFAPTQLEGRPVKVIGTITFNFRRG